MKLGFIIRTSNTVSVLLKAKSAAGEVLENRVFLGLIAGAVLGLILFFNLPSLESLLVQTAALSVGFGALGLAVERGSVKLAAPIVLLGTLLCLLWLFHSSQCAAYGVIHGPAENSITGEVVEDGFNGFRLKRCDRGHYPWYFEDADRDDLRESGIDTDNYYPPPPEVELRVGHEGYDNGSLVVKIRKKDETDGGLRPTVRSSATKMFYSRPGKGMQSAKEFSQGKAFEANTCSGWEEVGQGIIREDSTSLMCDTSVPFPDHDRPLQLKVVAERYGESKTDSATCQPHPNGSVCTF